jgi:2-dehydropantoate 2-reductase
VDLIRPAVTPGYSIIVLIQNGLNIEKPLLEAFPSNIVLSGVSVCGSHEVEHGHIVHDFPDELYIGAFDNPSLKAEVQEQAAKDFVQAYSAAGKTKCSFKPDVAWTRWRKLLYNACLNPICAITDLDTGRIRLAPGAVDDLVRPAMEEIRMVAKALGHDLSADLIDFMITIDPIDMYNPPSMQEDVRKVC